VVIADGSFLRWPGRDMSRTTAGRSPSSTYGFWGFVAAYALGDALSGLERAAALTVAATVLTAAVMIHSPSRDGRTSGRGPALLLAAAVAGSAVTPAAALFGVMAAVVYQRADASLFAVTAPMRAWALCGLVAIGSVPVLLVWHHLEGQRFMLLFRLPDVPGPVKVLLLVGAAATNAVFEETLWRRVWPELVPRAGLLQLAAGFGAVHFRAIPFGISGVVLTTVFAGLAQLMVRHGRGSILPAIVAHLVGDTVLFFIVFQEML
jgi:Type II CAAX prenyl endopeptidase Rce1-like